MSTTTRVAKPKQISMTSPSGVARPTEAICPSWCLGHDDSGYQSWETMTDGTGPIRDHDSDTTSYGPVEAGMAQTEHAERGLESPHVQVYVNHGDGRLTEAQAHELGMALVRAADVLRRARMEATR